MKSSRPGITRRFRGWTLVVVATVLTACACAVCLVSDRWVWRNGDGSVCSIIATALSIGTAAIAIRVAATGTSRPDTSAQRSDPKAVSQISGRLMTVQEEERKSLSRDLHDGIGQILTALKM